MSREGRCVVQTEDGCGGARAVQVGVDRWRGPWGLGGIGEGGSCPPQLSGKMVVLEMDTGDMGRRQGLA